MSDHQQAGESIAIAAKAYVFGVGGMAFLGITLQQWVLVTALLVAVCQLIHWAWRFYIWLRFDRGASRPGQS